MMFSAFSDSRFDMANFPEGYADTSKHESTDKNCSVSDQAFS